ncbi:MAG: ABC transporter permease [Acidimicrobiia bacterium]
MTLPATVVAPPPPGFLKSAWRLNRTKVGVGIVLLLVLIALLGPFIAPYGERESLGLPNQGDAPGTVFGTGKLGYDVWTRFLYGGRPILIQAFLSTLLALVVGSLIGLVAAYNRRRLDDVLMRSMDVILAMPQIILVLVVISMFGAHAWLIVLAVGFSTVPRIARVVRGAAVSVVERDFVASAEALGEPRWRILSSELLPNITAPLLVEANLRLTFAIAAIGGIAFLGFAADIGAANWGLMINEHRGVLAADQPWGTLLPVFAIALLTIGTGLIGDGMSRAAAGIDRATAV